MLLKLRNFFYEWLDREEPFIFWMTVFNITCSFLAYNSFFDGSYIFSVCLNYIALDFMIVIIIDFISYCLLKKYRFAHNMTKIIFIMSNAAIFAADIFTIYFYRTPLNNIMFEIMMGTNFREGGEFLKTFLKNLDFLIFICKILVPVFIARMVIKFIFDRRKALMLVSFLLIFLMGVSNVGIFIYFNNPVNVIATRVGGQPIYEPRILTTFDFLMPRLAKALELFEPHMPNTLGLMRIGLLYHINNENLKNYEKMINETPKNLSLTKNESTIPYIVFILGESTNRNHMSLYSYRLPTNPLLSKRLNEGLYVFNDVISPQGYTITAMKKLFNFYNYESKGEWYSYHNIFSILKKAGYNTTWISNQGTYSLANPNHRGMTPATNFPRLCNVIRFVNILEETVEKSFPDEVLLPIIDEELKNVHEKNFYLIQISGTHLDYKNRYTSEFQKFNSKDEFGGGNDLTDGQRQIVAEYDNSVLYNDFIIDEIIKRFEDKNAIIIYISDHGECLYEYAYNSAGHKNGNMLGHGDILVHPSVIEIPMIIWTSKNFQATYPELNKRISGSVNRPYMTDDIIHTMLDITGIETEDYEPSRSIINASFDATRPRIYSKHLYDREKGLIEIR